MKSRFAANVPVGVALRSACLIAVAVGIFGMHALANCGMPGMPGMPGMLGMPGMAPTSMAQTADSGSSAHGRTLGSGQAGMASVTLDGKMVQAGPVVVGSGMGMGMRMVEWCLAVLVVGLGAVMYLRLRRLRGPAWLLPRFSCLFAIIERTGRQVDAPSLSQLSVLRC